MSERPPDNWGSIVSDEWATRWRDYALESQAENNWLRFSKGWCERHIRDTQIDLNAIDAYQCNGCIAEERERLRQELNERNEPQICGHPRQAYMVTDTVPSGVVCVFCELADSKTEIKRLGDHVHADHIKMLDERSDAKAREDAAFDAGVAASEYVVQATLGSGRDERGEKVYREEAMMAIRALKRQQASEGA